MSISGNLQTMELAELLQWVAQSNKTGTLIIQHKAIEQHIFFRDGRIIATASNEPHRQLGHFLVSRGLITEDDVDAAIGEQESTDLLLGQSLVARGAVTEDQVRDLLVQKADESVFEMFLWEEGEFRFVDEPELTGQMVEISLDVTGVVLQAAERVDDWRRIEAIIPSDRCVPVAVGFLEETGLPDGSGRVISLINDDLSVAKISEISNCSDLFVRQILFALIEKGRLKIVNPHIVELKHSTDLVNPDDIDATTHLGIAERRITQADFPMALRHLGAAHNLDPNGPETALAIESAEERIRQALDTEGIQLNAIPSLNLSETEIPTLRLSPEEGFVLSRIDGSYDIDSILKISPMPPLDARLVFRKLLKEGHIKLELPGS